MFKVYWVDSFVGGRISPKHDNFVFSGKTRVSIICLEETIPTNILDRQHVKIVHCYLEKIKPPLNIDGQQALIGNINYIIAVLNSLSSQGDHVVVHCGSGNDRTGLVLLAYLCRIKNWKYDSALDHLLNKNPLALSFGGFRDLAKSLYEEKYYEY
jgi:protein-tyrosine phosphatase